MDYFIHHKWKRDYSDAHMKLPADLQNDSGTSAVFLFVSFFNFNHF